MGVQYSLVVIKDPTGDSTRIVFDQLPRDEIPERYANANHRCQEPRRERSSEDDAKKGDEKEGSKEGSKEESKEGSKTTVDETLAKEGAKVNVPLPQTT
jgi:hypothetical protein